VRQIDNGLLALFTRRKNKTVIAQAFGWCCKSGT
jgi:hypothetical protein